MNLLDFQVQFKDEAACLAHLEQLRWGDNCYCPHCGSFETYKFKDGRLFKCADCKKQFTVKVGTIFSDSHIPLQKWFLAIYLHTSLKKGVSSIQLAKYLKLTQKSSWFMLQRIRHAEATGTFDKPLEGTVEIDEAYLNPGRKIPKKRRGTADKEIVFGAVERGGRVRLHHVPSSGSRTLLPKIKESISLKATVYSDEWGAYKRLAQIGYTHEEVNHSKMEFVRGAVHTNTIEGGVWDHFKLSLKAIYVGVSAKHLAKYCDEFAFRYSTRQLSDGERFDKWFDGVNGKRLTYKKLTS